MPKLYLVIGVLIAAGLIAGTIGFRTWFQQDDVCARESYGVDYDSCVKCIGAEEYCRQIWIEFADTPTPTPTATPSVNCNEYTQNYQTCLACINQASCDQIFRRSAVTPSPQSKTATLTPTPKSTPATKSSSASPTATLVASPTPTPVPTPTPSVNCNEYTQNYQTCLACINQAFCDQLFDR